MGGDDGFENVVRNRDTVDGDRGSLVCVLAKVEFGLDAFGFLAWDTLVSHACSMTARAGLLRSSSCVSVRTRRVVALPFEDVTISKIHNSTPAHFCRSAQLSFSSSTVQHGSRLQASA